MHPRLAANLMRFSIERTRPSHDPAPTITAPTALDAVKEPDKLLLDQREAYFRQSDKVRNGVWVPFRLVRR